MTVADIQGWVGPSEAARIAGLSTQHMVRLADAGRIPCEKTPLGRVFDPVRVRAWADERESGLR